MKPQGEDTPRECLFAQRYEKEEGEVFVGLYRFKGRLLLVSSEERGGDVEVELASEDARQLMTALEQGLKS